jgi:peptide/nickel transport system substrate-binding protein
MLSQHDVHSRTRRRWRKSSLVLLWVIMFASLVSAPTLANPQQVQRGGTVVEAGRFGVRSLDPHIDGVLTFYDLLFDTLFEGRLDAETGQVQILPALAESWEVIDSTTLELRLRQGVEFHDGSDFNATVAKWNILRARNHEKSNQRVRLENIKDVEIVEEYTIRLLLEHPQPDLPLQLSSLVSSGFYIISQQAMEELGEEEFARNPVGSGPMQFERWIPDDRVELIRFPNHWQMGVDGQPLPYFDRYVEIFMPDATVAVLELRTGGVDLLFHFPVEEKVFVEKDPNVRVQMVPLVYTSYPSLYFNPQTDKTDSPFSKDLRLRQAAQHAIDREAMAEVLGFGSGEPHYYWGWYPGNDGYDESLPRYEYNPEKARQLIAGAGYPNGIDVEVKVINRITDTRPLEVLQAMWKEVGINMKIVMMDSIEWIADGRANNYEAASHGDTARLSPLERQTTRSTSQHNFAGYVNPEVDALWAEVSVEYDDEKRAELFKEIQRHIYEDAYHLVGYRVPLLVGMNDDLQGINAYVQRRNMWLQQ